MDLPGHEPSVQEHAAECLVSWLEASQVGSGRIVCEMYPKRLPPGSLGLIHMRTNIYVLATKIGDQQCAVLLAALAGLHGSSFLNVSIQSLAAELAVLWKKVGRLNDNQAEAARKLVRLAGEEGMYRDAVSTSNYLSSWPPSEQQSAQKLLDELAELGVVREVIGGWVFTR